MTEPSEIQADGAPDSLAAEHDSTPTPELAPSEQTVELSATRPRGEIDELALEGGTITVAPRVVAKIASLAAQEVAGVHSLGVGSARSVVSVRDRIPGIAPSEDSGSGGVSVEVGQTQAAVDLDLVVEYGTPITQIARSVRRHVIQAVEEFTGLEVVEVNITVDDVHLPTSAEARGARLS